MATTETGFEKKRGINRVEIRQGYSQVHVTGLAEPVMESRLGVLSVVKDEGVSLDFLKLTTDGLSFLVPRDATDRIEACLAEAGYDFALGRDRSIVLVHAVNIRDEEGLIARIVAIAIATGAKLDHLGDMHDRLLIVAESTEAASLAARLQEAFA
jgi:hypothetical protein